MRHIARMENNLGYLIPNTGGYSGIVLFLECIVVGRATSSIHGMFFVYVERCTV